MAYSIIKICKQWLNFVRISLASPIIKSDGYKIGTNQPDCNVRWVGSSFEQSIH